MAWRSSIVDPDQAASAARDPAPGRRSVGATVQSVALGYWNQPKPPARRSMRILPDSDCGTVPATGDLGCVHAGEVYVTGRLKWLLILGGRKLHAEDVERTVAEASHWQRPARRGCRQRCRSTQTAESSLVVVQEVTARASAAHSSAIVHSIRDGFTPAEHQRAPFPGWCRADAAEAAYPGRRAARYAARRTFAPRWLRR